MHILTFYQQNKILKYYHSKRFSLLLDKSLFTIYTKSIMARCGCRDKYINKDAVLTHQLQNDQLIKQLDALRSQLYILLGSPFQLLSNIEEEDGYKLGAYFIWQEYQQAELIGYQNWSISLDYQINVYKQVIDRLHKRGYNGNIQLKLDLGDNIILIDFVKKKRIKRKNNIINLNNVVQLKLGLVG